MHLSLLWLLGPFGHNYNSVVWPWNIAMILMAWIVFFRNDGAIFLPSLRPHLGKAIALLVVLMPLFNLFGKWDDYLSASLYSGRNISAWIFIGERSSRMFESKLSQAEMLRLQEAFDGYSFDATKWSLAELNVPLYPERRVFEVVATKLLHMGGSEGDVRLYVTEHRGILNDGPGEFREVPLR